MSKTMPDKNQTLWGYLVEFSPWLSTLALSMFASVAQYAAKVQHGKNWLWRDLFLDAVVCIFVGMLTHMLCSWQGVDGMARSVLVAISAHMGTRAMAQYERIRDRVLGHPD